MKTLLLGMKEIYLNRLTSVAFLYAKELSPDSKVTFKTVSVREASSRATQRKSNVLGYSINFGSRKRNMASRWAVQSLKCEISGVRIYHTEFDKLTVDP